MTHHDPTLMHSPLLGAILAAILATAPTAAGAGARTAASPPTTSGAPVQATQPVTVSYPTGNPYLQYVPASAQFNISQSLLSGPAPVPPAQAKPANGLPPANGVKPANGAKPANGGPPADAKTPPAETQAPDISGLLRAFGQYFTEEETDLLLDYLRDAALASVNGGEEVFLPPDLAFKLEILQQRMKKEGAFYFQVLIQQLERDLERAMQEYRNPPPPPPYQLPQQRGRAY